MPMAAIFGADDLHPWRWAPPPRPRRGRPFHAVQRREVVAADWEGRRPRPRARHRASPRCAGGFRRGRRRAPRRSGTRSRGSEMPNVSRLCVSIPLSTCESALKLRSNTPAPASSTSATPTSAATRRSRVRRARGPVEPPRVPPSFRSSFGTPRAACIAGARPKTTPVNHRHGEREEPARAHQRRSRPGAGRLGVRAARATERPHVRERQPRHGAGQGKQDDSVNNCGMSRVRLAPSASRTAISRRRDAARPSRRFATFAQAIARRNRPRRATRTAAGSRGRRIAREAAAPPHRAPGPTPGRSWRGAGRPGRRLVAPVPA